MTMSPLSSPPAPAAPSRPVPRREPQITPDDLVQISELLVGLVPGADHACVIVTPQRGVEIVGSSDRAAQAAVDIMLTLGGGQAPGTLRDAIAIDAHDLAAETPWPEVARSFIHDVGVGGMIGRRLVAGERRVGFLAVYSDAPGGLADASAEQVDTLATLIGGWVVAHETSAEVNHLRTALENARLMGRAVGMVMAQRGMLSDEAFAYLRAMSNRMNVRVRELAIAMLRAHEQRITSQHIAGTTAPGPETGIPDEPEVAGAEVAGAEVTGPEDRPARP